MGYVFYNLARGQYKVVIGRADERSGKRRQLYQGPNFRGPPKPSVNGGEVGRDGVPMNMMYQGPRFLLMGLVVFT